MNKKLRKLFILISLTFIVKLQFAAGSGMVVVVSPTSPIKNVSEADIRNLYLGKIKQIGRDQCDPCEHARKFPAARRV